MTDLQEMLEAAQAAVDRAGASLEEEIALRWFGDNAAFLSSLMAELPDAAAELPDTATLPEIGRRAIARVIPQRNELEPEPRPTLLQVIKAHQVMLAKHEILHDSHTVLQVTDLQGSLAAIILRKEHEGHAVEVNTYTCRITATDNGDQVSCPMNARDAQRLTRNWATKLGVAFATQLAPSAGHHALWQTDFPEHGPI